MGLRRSSLLMIIAGTVLVLAAIALRYVVMPHYSQLPANFSQTMELDGTTSAVNPQAFARGDMANLTGPTVPYKGLRTLTVDATSGRTAIVSDTLVMDLPGGAQQKGVHTYAIDRKTFRPVALTPTEKADLVPENRKSTFEEHTGYAFGFPSNPSRSGLSVYDPILRASTPARYVSAKSTHDRTVDTFALENFGEVKDPAMTAAFAQMPRAIPRALVGALQASAHIPPSSVTTVATNLATLPEMLPTSVVASSTGELGIDSQFGAPVDADQTQTISLAVSIKGEITPIMQLSSTTVKVPQSASDDLMATLNSRSTTLSLATTWTPIGLAVVGIGLVVFGAMRRRKIKAPSSFQPEVIAIPSHP